MPEFLTQALNFAPAIVAVLTAIAGVIFFMIRSHHATTENARLKEQLQSIQLQNQELKKELAKPKVDSRLRDENKRLKQYLQQLLKERPRLIDKGNQLVTAYRWIENQYQRFRNSVSKLLDENKVLKESVEAMKDENTQLVKNVEEVSQQFEQITSQDGNVWQRPLKPSAISFRPLPERGFPIISLMNLKGGVGKTTLTAHLAGILGDQGKRVLLIDLDFQRSLSLMLLRNEQRKILHHERKTLQHFFTNPTHRPSDLLKCAVPVPGLNYCHLISNTDEHVSGNWQDSLEETENRLMTDWVTMTAEHDIRLLLREALHDPEITRQFDYVLLDCPPRMTTAAINALAASDFVLIPVQLDAMSSRALPEFLRSLSRLHQPLLRDLDVLSVVANLVSMRLGKPIQAEAAVWEELRFSLRSVWPKTVPFAETVIPTRSSIGRASGTINEGELELAWKDEEVHTAFRNLVRELEQEIQRHERRHPHPILTASS